MHGVSTHIEYKMATGVYENNCTQFYRIVHVSWIQDEFQYLYVEAGIFSSIVGTVVCIGLMKQ